MTGRPTVYRDVQYRSRLEAKWAAMFDLLGWSYQYEPFDLPGWIPDFSIEVAVAPGYALVEVKPFASFDDFDRSKITTAVVAGMTAGTIPEQPEILLLGLAPWWEFGWLLTAGWCHPDGKYEDDMAILNCYGGRFGYRAEYGSYQDRITGLGDGNHFVVEPWEGTIGTMWAQASNTVQWRSPR